MPMISLTPPQQAVLERGLLQTGFNCILQMPTGSGKTWLAEQAIADVLQNGYRAIYLTPLRALATELTQRWQTCFTQPVGVFTGDYDHTSYPMPFAKARLLVMTPERLDACTRAWRTHWGWIPEVDLVVVDELHLLGERQRGARLEGTLSRLQRLNPFARILGLSATLGNRGELADWLEGVEYQSTWQPVPLEWHFVRYRKANEKPGLLAEEVTRNRDAGGRSLVFVQSRHRAEALSQQLQTLGLRAHHHHAGLSYAQRQQVEKDFRAQTLEVLIATATLEMGLNLPVRQVVLYDLQTFNGQEFEPLPTNNVWQRVGRAGRPGLDTQGEAVLLVPTWESRQVERYVRGDFEPIRSGLADPRAVAEQILIEVSAGLARTSGQVREVLKRSLAAQQQRLPDVDAIMAQMLQAEMICETKDEDTPEARLRLKSTRLGRIATRHFLAPTTVMQFRSALTPTTELTFFDWLLLATSSSDCEPVLPVDFEELDELTIALAREPSHWLQSAPAELARLTGASGKRLLAALKMALVMRAWTRCGDGELVAAEHHCYGFEIERLRENLERLLLALRAMLQPTDESETPTIDTDLVSPLERLQRLQTMIGVGLDEQTVTLTVVNGIGPAWARRLKLAGIRDIEDLAMAGPADLVTLGGITGKRAQQWITEAEAKVKTHSAYQYREEAPTTTLKRTVWPADVDPYRLRRALELKVEPLAPGDYQVSGGLEPHRVQRQGKAWQCDCPDAQKGHVCKHTLAVRLTCGDRMLRRLVRTVKTSHSTQLNVFDLWFDTSARPTKNLPETYR